MLLSFVIINGELFQLRVECLHIVAEELFACLHIVRWLFIEHFLFILSGKTAARDSSS